MTSPPLFVAAAQALYGPLWQTELARGLGINIRTVRRYAQLEGEAARSIPPGVWADLGELLRQRGVEIAVLRKQIVTTA